MTQIELSQAELDLIQAKREEEAAKERRKQERIAEDIKKAEYNLAKRSEENAKQNAAARAFKKELGEGWEEQTTSSEWTEKVYWGQELVWSMPYTTTQVYLAKGVYKVNVNKHTVYSGTWGRGTDKGYKMFVSGPEIDWAYSQKALSKAATVNKKVQESVDTIKAREEHRQKKQSALETAVSDLKMKFPDAMVTAHKDWTRGYGKQAYREYNKLVVNLANGVQINYEVYADGRLERMNVLFGCKDEIALIGALGALSLPSTTE